MIITIIIPLFNSQNVLKDTLDSVLAQTYKDWECLIIDDGSTDNSVQIAKEFQKIDKRIKFHSRLHYTKPKGVSSCRNIGIENSKGKFVIFLDSDDLLLSTCLEQRISFISRNNEYDFWVFKMQEFNGANKGKICNIIVDKDTEITYLNYLLKGNVPFSVTCPLWKLSDLKKLNGFDENFQRLEDPDLHIRAILTGLKLKVDIHSKPDCFYRVDNHSEKRFMDKKFIKKIQNSYISFIDKHASDKRSDYIMSIEDKNKQLSKLVLYVSRYYVFPYADFRFLRIFTFKALILGVLSLKTFSALYILFFYEKFNLNNLKGSGYFKLKKKYYP